MWRKICKEELRETRKVYFVMFAILLAAEMCIRDRSLNIEDFVAKERFANGRVCPLCGCIHVVRNCLLYTSRCV